MEPTSRAPDPVDLADAFFSLAHRLKRTVNSRVQDSGLSMARLRVLYQLSAQDGLRIGELSTCVDVAPRTMTSTVEAMERDGLVARHRDPHDRRATIVSITEAGRRGYDEGRRQQAAAIADLFAALDLEARRSLQAVLDDLEAAAEIADAADASPSDVAV
jgi:DNA-binding MarR family transcriptional regulator